MLGLAAGDALGTTLEFKPRDRYEPLTDIVGGGPFDLPAGCWTDDTSMAMALADSLATTGEFDARDLMQRFVSWWRDGKYSPTGTCFDIGITTSRALAHFESSGDPFAGSTDPESAGNGSLMRVSPVAVWGLDRTEAEMRRVAREQSRTTHAAPQCLDACEAYAVMLAEAIRSGDRDAAYSAGASCEVGEPILGILRGEWRDKPRHAIASSGYVVHSLEAALWCVDETDSYAEAVLLAANLGNDADTTAAIAGQLAGALYGATAIPVHWLEILAWRAELEGLAERLLRA